MSDSASEVVRMTTGMRFRAGSLRMRARTSRPFSLGRLRSRRIRCGRGARSNGCLRSRKEMACSPSETTVRRFGARAPLSPSWIRQTSPSLSSTSRISMGGRDKFAVIYPHFLSWQAEEKCGPVAGSGGEPDLSPQPLHDLLAQGQADPRPGILFAGVQALKNLKYLFGIFRVDADAVVFHGKRPDASGFLRRNVDLRRLCAPEFQRVADQVLE